LHAVNCVNTEFTGNQYRGNDRISYYLTFSIYWQNIVEIYFMCNALVSVSKILPPESSTCGRQLD